MYGDLVGRIIGDKQGRSYNRNRLVSVDSMNRLQVGGNLEIHLTSCPKTHVDRVGNIPDQ
jgi:hypothetical protein